MEADFIVPICRQFEIIKRSIEDFEIRQKEEREEEPLIEEKPKNEMEEKVEELRVESDKKNESCYCQLL